MKSLILSTAEARLCIYVNGPPKMTGPQSQAAVAADDSADGDLFDLADDEGWEDLEPDVEKVQLCCLLCGSTFEDAKIFLSHCKQSHELDIVKVQKDLGVHI